VSSDGRLVRVVMILVAAVVIIGLLFSSVRFAF
jgi:hypothetical protein